jgi:hypothetical protein
LTFALLLTFGAVFSHIAKADILELRYTINAPNDSTQIRAIAPVGDFNADGYGDLALGIRGIYPNRYEGVFLYYGGPDFDDQADLIFHGFPQNTIICGLPEDSYTGYGGSITGLGDYNGDGYDDFAVGSSNLCYEATLNGAVYIYLGSPFPDTTVNIFIPGEMAWDEFGDLLVSGNFNGDLYGDLLAPTLNLYTGQKVYIFLGSDPANGQYDWEKDYSGLGIWVNNLQGGHDINDDGYDDFLWNFLDFLYDTSGTMLFFGGDPIDTLSYAEYIDTTFYLKDDVSEDGVDDFIIHGYNPPFRDYLCLGGDPFDIIPDYGIPLFMNPRTAFVYNLPTGEKKFVMDNGLNRKLIFFNTGDPFDTTNFEFYYYGFQHGSGLCNIGDIDGIAGEEIVLPDYSLQLLDIYSGGQTGVDDNTENSNIPQNFDLLLCYPNPFNSTTKIYYYATQSEEKATSVNIYNISGEFVKKLYTKKGKEGVYLTTWDGTDGSGEEVSSGIYIFKVITCDGTASAKVTFLK